MGLRGRIVAVDGQEGTYVVLETISTIEGRVARLWKTSPPRAEDEGLVPVDRLVPATLEGEDEWHALCRLALLDLEGLTGGAPASAFLCRTIFKAYQFRPLLKYFGEAAKRLLMADEAGLGKTIEAGYIIVEEIARSGASRVVILCPSRLRKKWRAEMWRRFGLPFKIVRGKGLLRTLRSGEDHFLYIASMDSARSLEPERVETLPVDAEIDVLVVDEVHRMIGRTGDTLRRNLALLLSSISKGALGLSATPVQLEQGDLLRVFDVVAPGVFETDAFPRLMELAASTNHIAGILGAKRWGPKKERELRRAVDRLRQLADQVPEEEKGRLPALVQRIASTNDFDKAEARALVRREASQATPLARHLTRTRAAEVGEDRERDVLTIRVSLSTQTREARQGGELVSTSEDSLFREVDQLLRQSFSPVHRMQLSSSLPAMIGLLRRGMVGIRSWRAWDSGDEEAPGAEERPLNPEVRRESARLVDLFGLLPKDSKWQALATDLERMGKEGEVRKAIVFTHWIPTHDYLVRQARYLRGITAFHASSRAAPDDVTAVVSRFQRHTGFGVLFTTDILREGIDLQSADCVINYDLPYNPQVIEQRIGRIDRIGQASDRIRVVNFLVEGSLDERIHDVVLLRMGVFQRALGDVRPVIGGMLESIEQTGTIDEEEVIRNAVALEDRQRLMEHDAFAAVEDVLDEDVRKAHQGRLNGLASLHWLVLRRFFQVVAPNRELLWEQGCLTVQGIDDPTIEAIGRLAGHADRAMVVSELRASRGDGRGVRLCLGGGEETLPLSHPLFRVATEVARQSYGAQDGNAGGPELLGLSKVPGVDHPLVSLALVEYAFNGDYVRHREWRWFGVAPGGKVHSMDDADTAEILAIARPLTAGGSEDEGAGPLDALTRFVEEDLGN